MLRFGWLLLPILVSCIQSCDIFQMNNTAEIIFTGRILSLHQWSIHHPYSAFVWIFRIFHGESHLLKHHQWTHLQRPLYVIVDNLDACKENPSLKYLDIKIFGVRIQNAQFHSTFDPLPVTLVNIRIIEGITCNLIEFPLSLDGFVYWHDC